MAKKNKRKRNKTTATKSEVPVTTRDDSDQDKDEKEKLPEKELAKGATPAAHELAASQLDSDDDDCYKRSSNHPKQDASLRKERRKLYELQESKRRLRTEEGGRSKSKSAHGETPLARKVKRLKTERKAILDEYKETGGSMRKNNNNNTNKRKKKRSAGIPLPSNK